MRYAQRVLSTYSPDLFGICSALYELGGMCVMHDASGCNSSYNTHDEPRWYDMDSMIYVSGLTQKQAILGDDRTLVNDIINAAKGGSPAFIALSGSPVAYVTGTDYRALAKVIEHATGIVTFGFPTNGMRSYIKGAGMAFLALAKRIVLEREAAQKAYSQIRDDYKHKEEIKANIIGLTPLDFSIVGNVAALEGLLSENGISIIGKWAMGSTLDEIRCAALADINLVLSSTGILAARELKRRFGIPYVCGIPMGSAMTKKYISTIRDICKKRARHGNTPRNNDCGFLHTMPACSDSANCDYLIIGEPVFITSLAYAIRLKIPGVRIRTVCPIQDVPKGNANDGIADFESEYSEEGLGRLCKSARYIIADPIYARLIPKQRDKFISFPHEAYSGRYFRKDIPVFAGSNFDKWYELIHRFTGK